MKHQTDDIGNLFEAQGSSGRGYRELARETEARDAQARWPLFRSLAPEKAEQPAVLSTQLRAQLWHGERSAAPVARPRLPPQGEGKSLQQGLQQLAVASGKETSAVLSAPHGIEPARHPATAAWVTQGPVVELAAPPARGTGLFSPGAFLDNAKPATPRGGSGDNSLAQVFGRLAGAPEPALSMPPKPASFFARFGRR